MCGIAGILGPEAGRYEDALEAMLSAMSHRGPDGSGIFRSENCLLGHRRLAIIDTSAASDQPFSASGGNQQLIYNGECYNFPELKAELEAGGERFQTSGDTEVVCRLISKFGAAGLTRLNAMFALAFWDEAEQSLLLARDSYGQKPLYYWRKGQTLVFASEVRALLASGLVPRQVSAQSVISFLAYGCVQPPATIVNGVFSLPKGRLAKFNAKTGTFQQGAWQPGDFGNCDGLKDSFGKSVARHLISDVPIGIFLSGGIDSSAVLAAARHGNSGKLISLSVTFPDSPTFCEGQYSTQVAQMWESDHREIPFLEKDILRILPDAIAAMDQPTVDGINTYIISEAARSAGLTVALSGLGGDEIFGGYDSFRLVPKAFMSRKLCSEPLSSAVRWLTGGDTYSRRSAKLAELFLADADLPGAYLARRRMFTTQQIRSLIPDNGHGWISGVDPERLNTYRKLCGQLDQPDAISLLEMSFYMEPMLLRDSDCMGMAHSLEIRLPFLDAQFSRQALSISGPKRVQANPPKKIFVESLGSWLPESITQRRKQGFVLPLSQWMRSQLKDAVSSGLDVFTRTFCGGSLEVNTIWESFLEKPERVGWIRPWSLFVLGAYIRQHSLDTGGVPSSGDDLLLTSDLSSA